MIDTSAVLALHDPQDGHHQFAVRLFNNTSNLGDLKWLVLDATTHELFTRARYNGSLRSAQEQYAFVRRTPFRLVRYLPEDEKSAEALLEKYADQRLSFHDALCSAVMLRLGVYRIFAFDFHFSVVGFQVIPGMGA